MILNNTSTSLFYFECMKINEYCIIYLQYICYNSYTINNLDVILYDDYIPFVYHKIYNKFCSRLNSFRNNFYEILILHYYIVINSVCIIKAGN